MESALWAINLCAVVYLCFWAIKTDDKEIEIKKTEQGLKEDEKKS
jgi:hypothetical protein